MSVTFLGAGSRVDSGGSTTTAISVPRPGGLAIGDYVIVWGYTESLDDWIIGAGADGVPFQRLAKVGKFQAWGKRIGTGFGTTTAVDFSAAVKVWGMVSVVYRGANGVSAVSSDTLTAPAATRLGANGQCIRLFGAKVSGTALLNSSGTVRVAGSAYAVPLLVTDTVYSLASNIGPSTAAAAGGSGGTAVAAVTIQLAEDAPPNAPALNAPIGGVTIDRSVVQRFSWTPTFPLAGGVQSAFTLKIDNFIDPTTTVEQNTPNPYYDLPAGTLPATGSFQWAVFVTNGRGIDGPPSVDYFTAIDHPDGATVTYPTSGGTASRTDRIDWSYPTQDAYQVQRVADNDGVIDTGTVYYDSGTVDDPDNLIRSQPLDFETNDRYEWLRLRVRTSGIWSDWDELRVLVSYIPPPAPVVTVSEGDDGATIVVSWTIPDPVDDQPDPSGVELRYSTNGGATSTRYRVGLPVAGQDTYWTPQHGVEYCFRATSLADNGTSTASDWIARDTLSIDQIR